VWALHRAQDAKEALEQVVAVEEDVVHVDALGMRQRHRLELGADHGGGVGVVLAGRNLVRVNPTTRSF